MRVLTVFIDMIRANRLSTFNDDIKVDTPLDIAFKNLGGTVYENCFTPGPDTPRGISTFLTGKNPYENGCNTRLKWPYYFLKNDRDTIFDLFIKNNYTINCFSSPKERETGLFPEHISKMDIHNDDYNMNKYLSEIELEDNHFVFVSVPDYHWAFDDFGYTTNGEKKSYHKTKEVFDMIFSNLNKEDFEHIFIFSDHGFKFNAERRTEPYSYMLNEDRTNCIMIHRERNQKSLIKKNKLCSLADLYPTYQDILNSEIIYGISLLSKNEHEFIILEDHINFAPSINQNIELWALVNKEFIYIRELSKAMIINRKTRIIKDNIIDKYDNILKNNSSFGMYINEYEKVFRYRKNISSKSFYMSGKRRIERSKFILKYFLMIDLLKQYIGLKL